jgi:phage terminase small subunit
MKLTAKQEKFCNEYLIDLNATQAAIRAGYSPKTAMEQGYQLLQKTSVSSYLKEMREKDANKAEITRQKVISEYAKLAFFDIRKVLTVDGGLKDTTDWDDDSAAAIAGLESYDEKEPDSGMVLGTVRKIKISDKRAALDSLCKVLGFNAPEKSEIKMDNVPFNDSQVEKILHEIKRSRK